MWENTVAIHSILKEKKLQSEIFNQVNIKKVKLTKIILEKKMKIKNKKGGKMKSAKKMKKKLKEKKKEMHCGLLL
jgi:vacuolar-type H+-ATPase catalytic subunit A/Vma1